MVTHPMIDRRLRSGLGRWALALLAGISLVSGCRKGPPEGIALVGATVIDGTGAPPKTDQVVVVRAGKIESISSVFGFDAPKNTREINVGGRFIIPGLIDAHAHVTRWMLPRYLAYGVTSVRDTHGTLDSILAIRDGAELHSFASPRIYTAGSMIDGVPATYADAIPVQNPTEGRKAVDKLAVADVDFIKVYTRITPALLGPIIDEARTFKLRVSGHLGLTDALTAARLGIHSIEHMSGIPEAASSNPAPFFAAHRAGFFTGWTYFEKSWANLDSASLDRVAHELASRKVVVVPTLVLHDIFSRLDDPAVESDSALRDVPKVEVTRWNVPGMIQRAGWGPADFAAFRASRPNQDLFIRLFQAAGGTVATGTDAANQLLVPGKSEHQELALLTAAGLTPNQALQAGTRNAATLLGADSLGVLAPGKVADLVILTRNPLTDIRNTQSVERVMVRGVLFRADSIRSHW